MRIFLQLARNSALTIVFHVAPRFANVVLFILIGRLAGPSQAGIFSLATTYLLIATTVMRGLDELLIRQIVREPDRAANYFGNFLLLRFAVSVGVYAALALLIQYGLNYAASTSLAIMILTFSVLPDSLGLVAQSVLLGHRRFGAPAAILGSSSLFKVVAGALVLLRGGGLIAIAWLWLLGSGFAMIALLVIAFRQIGGLRRANWMNFAPLRTHWHAALSFSAIATLVVLDSQTDTVLLSVFRGEAEVGWYNAATTITFSLLILSQVYRFAVYPLMVDYAEHAPEKLYLLFQKSIYYMGVMSLPMVAGIIILAPQIVLLVFGPKFAPSILVLQILVMSLLFLFMSEPCNRMMFVKDRQRILVGFLTISASMNIVLNLLLIPKIGASGAAISRTCSAWIYFALNYSYVYFRLTSSFRLRYLMRPLFSTAIMVIMIYSIMPSSIFISIMVGFFVYFIMLVLVRGIQKEESEIIGHFIIKRFRHNR